MIFHCKVRLLYQNIIQTVQSTNIISLVCSQTAFSSFIFGWFPSKYKRRKQSGYVRLQYNNVDLFEIYKTPGIDPYIVYVKTYSSIITSTINCVGSQLYVVAVQLTAADSLIKLVMHNQRCTGIISDIIGWKALSQHNRRKISTITQRKPTSRKFQLQQTRGEANMLA